jgi:hypothetical protein
MPTELDERSLMYGRFVLRVGDPPESTLYATSARIGGTGLDAVALETLRGIRDWLGLAIAYGNPAREIRRGFEISAGIRSMVRPGGPRVREYFTWEHFRQRVRDAYRAAIRLRRPELVQ